LNRQAQAQGGQAGQGCCVPEGIDVDANVPAERPYHLPEGVDVVWDYWNCRTGNDISHLFYTILKKQQRCTWAVDR